MDVVADYHLLIKLSSLCGLVIINFCKLLVVLFVVYSFGSPDGKAEERVFDSFGGIECPLYVALHKMKQILRMLLNPLAECIVIICCKT